jgi:predicted ArsR family transcriptional regulator
METTRQTILGILRRREATVEELTRELGLAPATVRRHLDILSRDGHVDVKQVRRQTGRPHYVFSLSETGEDLFPKHYVQITNRLIEEIVSLEPDETSGRGGDALADLVFKKMAERLAERIGPRVHGATMRERVEAVVDAVVDEGIEFELKETDGTFLLLGHGCPCPRVSERYDQVCDHHDRLLSLLLTADVTRVNPAVVGEEGCCAHRVRERSQAGSSAA